jgi:hypothetical protein
MVAILASEALLASTQDSFRLATASNGPSSRFPRFTLPDLALGDQQGFEKHPPQAIAALAARFIDYK